MTAYDGYGAIARVYDKLNAELDYGAWADFFEACFDRYLPARPVLLLDLACGTGSISVEMAKRGYDVIGVDSSIGMLNSARSKAYENDMQILLLNQSMDELDLYGTVDCAVCVLDSINHLDDAAQVRKTFEKVSLFMNPGGAFAFDVNTLYKHKNVLGDNVFVYDLDELYCIWQNSWNEEDSSVDISLDFFEEEDGAYYRSGESFTERAYELDDIALWLEEAGFEVVGIYDDMTTEKARPETERAVFLAKKK